MLRCVSTLRHRERNGTENRYRNGAKATHRHTPHPLRLRSELDRAVDLQRTAVRGCDHFAECGGEYAQITASGVSPTYKVERIRGVHAEVERQALFDFESPS